MSESEKKPKKQNLMIYFTEDLYTIKDWDGNIVDLLVLLNFGINPNAPVVPDFIVIDEQIINRKHIDRVAIQKVDENDIPF